MRLTLLVVNVALSVTGAPHPSKVPGAGWLATPAHARTSLTEVDAQGRTRERGGSGSPGVRGPSPVTGAGPAEAPGARELPDTIVGQVRVLPESGSLLPDPAYAPGGGHRLRLGLGSIPLLFPLGFDPAPGLDEVWAVRPWWWGAIWTARLNRTLEAQKDSLFRPEAGGAGRGEARGVAFLPEPDTTRRAVPAATTAEAAALQDFLGENADIGMQLRGRAELGGDWTRFRPCDSGIQFSCNPSLFPQLKPDIQFGIQVGGTISDRVHVNVDYDQTREFSAANNINVYYQGLEDEILQRVEVGDVTFSLPESRFLTQGIPAGNFGFRATGQLGPIDFQTVWAQQKGDLSSRDLQFSGVGGTQGFVQEDTLVVDDADYVVGQFLFLMDPRVIAGYPHVDILSLSPDAAPPNLVPGPDAIQLYRFESDPVTRQQIEGYIQADAVAALDTDTVRESGWFRFLQSGVDYFVHPSGLWIALRSPLRREEMLAVTYVAASGDTIGDYNPERIHNAGQRPTLRLLRASGANHQPGRPTWDIEMHQVYRVSGSNDVEVPSVGLSISLGELSAGQTFKRGPGGEDITFLKLLGLDEESPTDVLDHAFVYKPGADSFEDQPAVSGTFIVFPTLRPFAAPPPVPSLGLSAVQTGQILGADANQAIYDAEDPFVRSGSGLYRLTIPFRIRSEGVVSSFSLGALGVRDGSERIYLGERLLEAGTDYVIDYDLGQVTLTDAQGLFAGSPGAQLRANWEQKAIFDIAPTSVFGFNAGYRLGQSGRLNFLGLYQSEKALVNRPTLGVEPASILLGGVNGELELGASWLDRALDHVPGLRYSGESSLTVNGEMAVSLPNPNTRDDVFIDDFDSTNDTPLPVVSQGWRLGSAPQLRDGALDVLPPALNESDVALLAWQHTWVQESTSGDSVGVFEGFIPNEDIDREIRVTGTQVREPGLLMTFGLGQGDQGRFDRERWRSVTTVLSTTGLDLTKTEFLEFYLAQGDSLTLVLDLGTVSEDAMFVDSAGRTVGVKESGVSWGTGRLDQEADPRLGEIWADPLDALGVWGEGCLARRAQVYPVGDPRANCTRGNGRADSEDLDGNGNLDQAERYVRYVVKLDGTSPFLARTRVETGTLFRLFRIPLRGPDAVNPGGMFTAADWRAVKHLRVTMTGRRADAFVLARMRLIGSRWVKRLDDGVVTGIAGDTLGTGGQVEITSVSELTEGGAYQPPPGVLEQLDDPTTAFGGQGVEFDEKALGLRYRDLPAGERIEVYNRFPQRPRNFLTYRQARLWVVAREGDWGPDRPLSFFMKVGNDSENFYVYRTRLTPAANPAAVAPGDWAPEVVVDFDEWLDLRQEAESLLLVEPPAPGAPPLVLWNADSTYAVVLKDRARSPSLAQVRELSLGIWNEGGLPTSGEVWVNEFRFSAPVRDAGVAGYVNVDFRAADVLTTRVSYSDQGPLFRQLEGDPTYQQNRALNVTSTLQLGRFTPGGWGIDLPISVNHAQTSRDPTFLAQSDIRAAGLPGLRRTFSRRTRVGIGFRKRTPTANPWIGAVLDGLDVRVGYSRARSGAATSENRSDGLDAAVTYARRLEARDVGLVPGFLEPVIRAVLPGFLEDRVVDSRLRWSPERLSMSGSYFSQENLAFRYDQIVELPGDSLVAPTRSPREGLESTAQIGFRPFETFTADLSFLSTRDLLRPREATPDRSVRPLLVAERTSVAGVGLGWETNRSVRTQFAFRPELAPGLRTTLTMSTTYTSDRNATLVERTVTGSDTARALQRDVNGLRDVGAALALETDRLLGAALGVDEEDRGFRRSLVRVVSVLDPLDVNWRKGLTTRFNRSVIDPSAGFQLGWGDRDDFRVMDGDTAAVLVDRTQWSAGSGVRLPLSLGVDVEYSRTLANTFDVRSDRKSFGEVWPDIQVGIRDLPLPAAVRPVVQRLTASSGFQKSFQRSSFGVGGQQSRERNDRRYPVNVAIRWGGSLNTSYRGAFQTGVADDPTGRTEQDRVSHSLSVNSSFTPPGNLGQRLARPVQLSVRYLFTSQSDCRVTLGNESCVPFVDQRNQTFNLTVDSTISQLELGLQLSYTDRQSGVGQRNGSTQFQLGFFGQFLFTAGALERLGGR